jgi:hypothetical protein
MSVIRRWKLTVCGDCGKAAGDGPHLTCDLNARNREFEVVLACAYDALRDQHAGAVGVVTNLRRALAAAARRLDDSGHPEGAEEAREVLDATGGQ